MRAFLVAWRAIVSFYNEMFLLVGLSLLWWLTGGVFVWPLVAVNGPWWLAPVLAIPAGPATAALANVTRRAARDEHVDRSFFWEGFRLYWRQALALNAISMGILALLCLNLLFYLSRPEPFLMALSFLWAYLIIFWLSVQLYLFPVLIALKEPTVLGALRTATVMAFANPLFSIILLVLAVVLTALSVLLAILLPMAWPALMALLGEHALKLMMERITQKSS
jgi:uncharacterized membrane protein YesL